MIKNTMLAALLIGALTTKAQHSVTKIWETDTTLAIPESVLPDSKKGILYVSLIDGGAWEVDGKGGVGKLDINGKVINDKWITGLNAPKGLGIWKNKLYVADVTEVVVVDIAKGKIINKIKIDSALNLNDITINHNGAVYVSDSKAGNVYKIENQQPKLIFKNLRGINGLKWTNNKLYMLTAKDVYTSGDDKQLTKIAEIETGGDGLEPVGNGNFIATSWIGYMYYLHADGKTELLLDTHATNYKTADIGFNKEKNIIYVPTFLGKSVAAYQLK